MSPFNKKEGLFSPQKNHSAFTLIELLVVMGILGVLMAVTILVINPAQYMKRSRDTNRASDMESIGKAINLLLASNVNPFSGLSSTNIYLSLPSDISPGNTICNTTFTSSYDNTTVYTFKCNANKDNLKNADGTGWLPINLKEVGLPTLPIDPLNTYTLNNTQRDDHFFAFITNGSSFELDSKPEYMGYKNRDGFPLHNASATDLPVADGGDNGLYEYGTQLTLMPDSGGLCPLGMVYVPSPADICLDQYEESYSSTGTKVDGTGSCSSNCPASKRNQNPWASRSGWPGVSQITAATYCANMGKVLPSDLNGGCLPLAPQMLLPIAAAMVPVWYGIPPVPMGLFPSLLALPNVVMDMFGAPIPIPTLRQAPPPCANHILAPMI